MKEDILLVVATNWKPNRLEFLSALGISIGGFGAQVFSDVYDCLFITSINVKEEFNKYYSVEYASLSEYVVIRYNHVLSENDAESEQIFLVTGLPLILNTNYEGNQLDTVLECIQNLEVLQSEG